MTSADQITEEQIARFNHVKVKLAALKPKETWGMRPTLKDDEIWALDQMLLSVHLHVILDFIAAKTYECVDSVGIDSEGGQWLLQQASVVSAAALFCKTWEPNK